uniref:DUF4456 domain-containing protein n=1 Tax=Macrostomum lignano TaxID=282301 RepID=A0A1I8F6R4_9PLAT
MLQRPGECGASLGDILHAMEEGYAFFLQHGKDGGHFVDRLVQPSLIRKATRSGTGRGEARLAAEERARLEERAAVPAQRLQAGGGRLLANGAPSWSRSCRLKEAELAAGRTQIDRLRDECEQLSERDPGPASVSGPSDVDSAATSKELESYIGRLDETLAKPSKLSGLPNTQLSADHDKIVPASVDAATKQLASAEAACDRQQERLIRAAVERERTQPAGWPFRSRVVAQSRSAIACR